MGKPAKQVANTTEDGPIAHGRCGPCGRTIRGFPGDYAKCAGCSRMTLLPADPPAGWRLVRDPDKLKVLPFFFVVSFYASIVAILWTGGGTDLAGGAIVILVFATWIYSIMVFAKAAERQKGWRTPVIEYHLASLIMLPCFYQVLPACNEVLGGNFGPLISLRFIGSAIGLFLCLLIYGDARRRVAHLRIVRAV